MLVIRRRPGQSILIGEDIEVQVTEVSPTRVKLCIAAPKEVAVMRKEVRLTREANLAAASGAEKFAELVDRIRKKSSKGTESAPI
jgi:carbon storage regulator